MRIRIWKTGVVGLLWIGIGAFGNRLHMSDEHRWTMMLTGLTLITGRHTAQRILDAICETRRTGPGM